MENKYFYEILKKVRSTPPLKVVSKEDYDRRLKRMGSLLLLFMEHCRICAIWAEKISYQGDIVPQRHLLYLLNNAWDYIDDVDDYIKDIKDKFNISSQEPYLYLSWHLHKKEIDDMGYANLPDPYEPLWRYVVRGGGNIRYYQAALLIVSNVQLALPKIKNILTREMPFIDINNPEALDAADVEFLNDPLYFVQKYIATYTTGYILGYNPNEKPWSDFK